MKALGAALAGAVAVTALSGCGLGAKQGMADAIARSERLALASGGAEGTVGVSVVFAPTRVPPPPGPPRVSQARVDSAPITIDFAHATAAIAPVGSTSPILLFAGTTVYQHREKAPTIANMAANNVVDLLGASATSGTGGTTTAVTNRQKTLLQRSRRPWLVFDFSKLSKRSTEKTAGSLGISPITLVRMFRGVLTGSVKRAGTENVDGTPTTAYTFNVGISKVESGLSTRDQNTLTKILRANAITGKVFKAEAWIGPDGLPRRYGIRLHQSLDSATQTYLFVQFDFTSFGNPTAIALPGRSEIAHVASFGALVHGAVGA